MDNLLLSQSVSDLAHGACRRAKGKEGDKTHYCDKFQFMLLFAVKSHDLDTMRACYMMEAEDFESNEFELMDTVDTLKRAISIVTKEAEKNPEGLDELPPNISIKGQPNLPKEIKQEKETC